MLLATCLITLIVILPGRETVVEYEYCPFPRSVILAVKSASKTCSAPVTVTHSKFPTLVHSFLNSTKYNMPLEESVAVTVMILVVYIVVGLIARVINYLGLTCSC